MSTTTPEGAQKLKPCPFCGGTETRVQITGSDDECRFIQCVKCEAGGPTIFPRQGEDTPTWNDRVSAPQPVGEEREKAIREVAAYIAPYDMVAADMALEVLSNGKPGKQVTCKSCGELNEYGTIACRCGCRSFFMPPAAPANSADVVICENCKEYHCAPIKVCECGGKTFSKTHPTNARYIKANSAAGGELDLSKFDGHTPGPWLCFDEGTIGHHDIVSKTKPKDGGDLICEAPKDWETSMPRWGANSKLIAAAPLLLAEVKRLRATSTTAPVWVRADKRLPVKPENYPYTYDDENEPPIVFINRKHSAAVLWYHSMGYPVADMFKQYEDRRVYAEGWTIENWEWLDLSESRLPTVEEVVEWAKAQINKTYDIPVDQVDEQTIRSLYQYITSPKS